MTDSLMQSSDPILFANGMAAVIEEFRSERLRERYYRVVHPSGLRIYLFPKALTVTSVLYATRFGAANSVFRVDGEPEDTVLPDGCAHFLEHKMFEEEDGSDAFERFSELGADANAYTSWDKTAYLFHATEHVEECLEKLLHFVSTPCFTEASVKKEQGIIAEEIRMNDDSPGERCFMNALRAIYEENAIRKEICGSEESITRITPEILYRCCELFYRPENMVLVVAGSIGLQSVIQTVDRAYASLPSGGATERPRKVHLRDENANEARCARVSRVEERMEVGKPMFVIAVKDHDAVLLPPRERMRRDALMSLVREMYFSTSGELYNRLLDDGVISPGFSAAYGATGLYAFLELAGESNDPDLVLSEVRRTIREAREGGVDAELFERARRVIYAKTVKSFDSTRTVSEMLLDYVLADYELFEYIALLDGVSASDVESLLQSAFPDEAFALSVISPLEDAEIDGTEQEVR